MNKKNVLSSIEETTNYVLDTVRDYPERNLLTALRAVRQGKSRYWPVMAITHQNRTNDYFEPIDELKLPKIIISDGKIALLANELISMLEPLKMLNPVNLSFSIGSKSGGTFVTCFGIPLQNGTPAFTKTIDQVLSEPWPNVGKTGEMPCISEKIKRIKDHFPSDIKIRLPDIQGPFNVIHSLIGQEAFIAPFTEPNKYHQLMDHLTDFWISSVKCCLGWIGQEYLDYSDQFIRLRECSVNLVSPEFYENFILPYDLRVATEFNPLSIHPCSGPHVFHLTLKHLPVAATEAGYVNCANAKSIGVDEALSAIGNRPVALSIGQELPEGKEFEFIKFDLDRYEFNKRLLFRYCGMHWYKHDRKIIRELHKKLDKYWDEKYNMA